MNIAENAEEISTTPSYTFTPRTDEDPHVLSINEIASEKLKAFKIAYLTWKQEGKDVSAYVVPASAKVYNKRNNSFKVKTFLDGIEQVIPASSISQLIVITEEDVSNNKEGADFLLNQTEVLKNQYLAVLEEYKPLVDLTGMSLWPKEQRISTIYGIKPEELNDLEKCKQAVKLVIAKKVEEEKQKLKIEYGESNANDEELTSILNYLDNISKDDTIFEGAENYETLLQCWPKILYPNPFLSFWNFNEKIT